MITGELKSKIDRVWDTFWSGGISNPLEVIEQITYLLIIRRLDSVFARTGATVGEVALIRADDPVCIAGAYFIRIRLINQVLPDYVAAALRSRSIQSVVWAKSHQSAQQNFSGPGLRALPLPVPPIEMQKTFTERVEAIRSRIETIRRALTADDELFVTLQSRAFRGEV